MTRFASSPRTTPAQKPDMALVAEDCVSDPGLYARLRALGYALIRVPTREQAAALAARESFTCTILDPQHAVAG